MRMGFHKSGTVAYINRTPTGLHWARVFMRRMTESFLKAIDHKVFRNFD